MSDNLSAVETAATPTERAKALLNLAIGYYEASDFILQEQTVLKALILIEELGDSLLQAKAYHQLCIVAQMTNRPTAALEYCHRAIALYEETGNQAGIASVLTNIGHVYYTSSDYPSALEYYRQALALSEEFGDKIDISYPILGLGNVCFSLSEYPSALEYYRRALALYEETGNQAGIVSVLTNIGNVSYAVPDYPSALEYYARALALSEEIGNKAGIADSTLNIGVVYHNLLEYTSALEYYARALALSEEIGNKGGMTNINSNIGLIYNELLEYTPALEYYHRALTLSEEIGYQLGVAIATLNIGFTYTCLSEYSSALEYSDRALLLLEKLDYRPAISRVKNNIGEIYSKRGFAGYDPQKAEEYLIAALVMNEELDLKGQNLVMHKNLSELYRQEEQWQEAYEHHKKFHALEKEVQSEEARKQAQKYDYERKLGEERARKEASDRILHNILPVSIAERLKQNESPIADHYESVSILFMDIVNFTPLSARVAANQLLHLLDSIFSICDAVIKEYGLEKIKTIGDSYMAVCGLPEEREDHAEAAAGAAIEMLQRLNALRINIPEQLQGDRSWLTDELALKVRIGLHCGPVVAGVIGSHKFAYDLWGDTVNTASRMESHSEAGHIHVSEDFYKQIKMSYSCEERGEMEIKGKGRMKTYFLKGRLGD